MYKGRRRTEMPPHIFAVADSAYRDMLQGEGRANVVAMATGCVVTIALIVVLFCRS